MYKSVLPKPRSNGIVNDLWQSLKNQRLSPSHPHLYLRALFVGHSINDFAVCWCAEMRHWQRARPCFSLNSPYDLETWSASGDKYSIVFDTTQRNDLEISIPVHAKARVPDDMSWPNRSNKYHSQSTSHTRSIQKHNRRISHFTIDKPEITKEKIQILQHAELINLENNYSAIMLQNWFATKISYKNL